jgi:hypothetical protein
MTPLQRDARWVAQQLVGGAPFAIGEADLPARVGMGSKTKEPETTQTTRNNVGTLGIRCAGKSGRHGSSSMKEDMMPSRQRPAQNRRAHALHASAVCRLSAAATDIISQASWLARALGQNSRRRLGEPERVEVARSVRQTRMPIDSALYRAGRPPKRVWVAHMVGAQRCSLNRGSEGLRPQRFDRAAVDTAR